MAAFRIATYIPNSIIRSLYVAVYLTRTKIHKLFVFITFLLLALFPHALRAQAISISGAPNSIFDGNVVEINISSTPILAMSMDISLPVGFELVAIENNLGVVILQSEDLGTTCPLLGGYYTCNISGISIGPGINPVSSLIEQQINFPGSGISILNAKVFVRLKLPICAPPVLRVYDEFNNPVPSLSYAPMAPLCSSVEIPTAVVFVPTGGNAIASRNGTPLILTLYAQTNSGLQPISEAISDPNVRANIFKCRRTSVDATYGACESGSFPGFLTLAAYNNSPASIILTAVNDPNPIPGDAQLEAQLETTNSISGSVLITVEQPVANGSLTLGSQPGLTISESTNVTFNVTNAYNANGGYEPLKATWAITNVSPSINDSIIRSWFNAAAASLNIAQLFEQVTNVTVEASHTNPDSSVTTANLTLAIDAAPIPPTSCLLVAEQNTIVTDTTTNISIVSADGRDLSDNITNWSIVSGTGELTVDPQNQNLAHYKSPTVITNARIHVELSNSICGETSLETDIEVIEDVRLAFAFAKKTIATGNIAIGQATITNLVQSQRSGLILKLKSSPALAVLNKSPRTDSKTIIAKNNSASDISAYTITIDNESTHQIEHAFLARHSAGCGKAHVELSLHRSLNGPAIAQASSSIEIECDPELTFATVFGRVFADSNNNQVQDDDEPGIAGALIASAAGVYAVSDRNGNYHLNRLTVGRHVIKIDAASLPEGTKVNEARREVTLTPGVFVRLSYAVEIPKLKLDSSLQLNTNKSGIIINQGKLTYKACFHLPQDGILTALRDKTVIIADKSCADSDEAVAIELPLAQNNINSDDHWLLHLRTKDGRMWLWVFAVHIYRRTSGDQLVVPWGPRFIGGLILPSINLQNRPLVFNALLAEAVNLKISATSTASCSLGGKIGPDQCQLSLTETDREVSIAFDAHADRGGDDPPLMFISLPLAISPTRHFFVGRASAQIEGLLQKDHKPLGNGGGAFFYRAQHANGVLATAGADLPARELILGDDGRRLSWGSIASRLLGHDPRRVFRSLDPENYYPTYGDVSTVIDEREAGGRFFARLQKGQNYAKWGGINTEINNQEYGQYIRSLYGFGAKLILDEPSQNMGVSLVAFGAKPDTVASHDEFDTTGGSLYFLSHRDVVEGSIHIVFEILDEISGLPIRKVKLTEGIDYEADYLGGRVSLDLALPMRIFGHSLTSQQFAGAHGRLSIDYEYYPGANLSDGFSAGGRIEARMGPLNIGGTLVSEFSDSITKFNDRNYDLLAATARLTFEDYLRLRVEFAHSKGISHQTFRSPDGGLTSLAMATTSEKPQGNAIALEASSKYSILQVGAYGRLVEQGFYDSKTAADNKLMQFGGRAEITPLNSTRIWLQVDHREFDNLQTSVSKRDLGLAGISHKISLFDLSTEGRFEKITSYDDTLALGAEIGLRLNNEWRIYTRRRQQLSESQQAKLSATAIGASLQTPGSLSFAAEAGLSDIGHSFGRAQAGIPLADGIEMYAAYVTDAQAGSRVSETIDSVGGSSLVVGGRQKLKDSSILYSEQRVAIAGNTRSLTRSVGAQTTLNRHLALVIAYERGAFDTNQQIKIIRDAGSAGIVYQHTKWSLIFGVDARHDDGNHVKAVSAGAHSRLEAHLNDAITVAAGGRGSNNYSQQDSNQLKIDKASWEASAGLAYRPIKNESINIFSRYALQNERTPAIDTTPRTISLSHLLAFSIIFNLDSLKGASVYRLPFDIGPKVYYRHTTVHRSDNFANDQALIMSLRGDWHLSNTAGFDASIEGRTCRTIGVKIPPSYGALFEASALVINWLRLGAGYNLSEIATSGVNCHEPGAKGLFVRAEALY
ncbi:MAG: hypothetical protein JW841_14215 [Deltaproteobacteria bacterium]|nr:hypothetical protein [Deltaproteobacteria bacterium]